MNESQRNDIISNAKYIRHIRPIDPTEITEYVSGHLDAEAIRSVLRTEAFALNIVEQSDGTFVPVRDTPVTGGISQVDELPVTYTEIIESLLHDKYGPNWAQGQSGDELRETIRKLKSDYYRQHAVTYDEPVALGYAIYHLPSSFASIQYVLNDLVEHELLPRKLQVLDVGAGVGGPALGLHSFLPTNALVDYHAVEPSAAAAAVLREFLNETNPNFHTTIHQETAESFTLDQPIDVLLFVNVLSELSNPHSVVKQYAKRLTDDGSIIMIEPADLNTSTGLRQIEQILVRNDLSIYSPTIPLWPGSTATNRGWSFDVKPDLAIPDFQRHLDALSEESGEFINVDVQYSYSILRSDNHRRISFTPDPKHYAKMASMDDRIGKRVHCVGIKLSQNLRDNGNPIYLVGDGSQHVDHYAVLVDRTSLNAAVETAGYGSLLAFENILVLWNDDEDAINLVVDGQVTVTHIE